MQSPETERLRTPPKRTSGKYMFLCDLCLWWCFVSVMNFQPYFVSVCIYSFNIMLICCCCSNNQWSQGPCSCLLSPGTGAQRADEAVPHQGEIVGVVFVYGVCFDACDVMYCDVL
jgi:hypothetical protein